MNPEKFVEKSEFTTETQGTQRSRLLASRAKTAEMNLLTRAAMNRRSPHGVALRIYRRLGD
jgi:hypothetical protein